MRPSPLRPDKTTSKKQIQFGPKILYNQHAAARNPAEHLDSIATAADVQTNQSAVDTSTQRKQGVTFPVTSRGGRVRMKVKTTSVHQR